MAFYNFTCIPLVSNIVTGKTLDREIGSQGGKREDRVPRVEAGEPPNREPVCRGTQYGTETLHAGPGNTFLFIFLSFIKLIV